MGGHGGGSYAVATDSPGQFKKNVDKVTNRFPLDGGGRFGEQPGRNRDVRRIYSDSPVKDAKYFYDTLGEGGAYKAMPNGKGYMKWFKDGTHVSYRPTKSSDGTPVIEITVTSPGSMLAPYQKIHFMEGASK